MDNNAKLTVQEKELIRYRLAECIRRIQITDEEDEVVYMLRRACKHLLDLACDNILRIRESGEAKE